MWDAVTGAVGTAYDGVTGTVSGVYDGVTGWANQTYKGMGQIKDGITDTTKAAGDAYKGLTKFGGGMQKVVGGNWLPIMGTVGLLAAKGLGLGSLVDLGVTGMTQAIKLGGWALGKGAGWVAKKLFGASKNPKKSPNQRSTKTSRVSLKHRRNQIKRQERLAKKKQVQTENQTQNQEIKGESDQQMTEE